MSKNHTGSGRADGSTEPADEPGVYRARYDPDGPATVADTVIRAIADVAGVDPTSTVVPLGDRVDPDALDRLFADAEGEAQVTFGLCGLTVRVRSDGAIRIADESAAGAEERG